MADKDSFDGYRKAGREASAVLAGPAHSGSKPPGLFTDWDYMPQRSAAVCTGASQNAVVSASSIVSVIEQPAMSSDVM